MKPKLMITKNGKRCKEAERLLLPLIAKYGENMVMKELYKLLDNKKNEDPEA